MTRLRFGFARKHALKYISHLDMVRLFHRALRRSGLPLAYSRGFNPHPRFNLALPLPLAATAAEEFGEVYFEEKVEPEQLVTMLGSQLPEGLELNKAVVADLKAPALPSLVGAALYRASLVPGPGCALEFESIRAALKKLLEKDKIMAPPAEKKKKKTYTNIRPYIIELSLSNTESRFPVVEMLLQAGSSGGVSPTFVLAQLEKEPGGMTPGAYWRLHRERLYVKEDTFLQPLSERM